jgi:transcriptional regulator with XRE-family HTH domain
MQGRHIDGKVLRDIRERQGLQRPELARLSGVSLSWIKYIELEGRQPSGVKAYALAQALNIDINAFSTMSNERSAA